MFQKDAAVSCWIFFRMNIHNGYHSPLSWSRQRLCCRKDMVMKRLSTIVKLPVGKVPQFISM